ncbi:MAG TPA: OsmC family protein [Chloroflexia bacterium]|nr:OsmC family protein [Chloroflexia bacterium]
MEEQRWSVRASWQGQQRTTVYARNNSFSVERQVSYNEADHFPCAVEYLLGALAGDLIAGMEQHFRRARLELDALEISLSARLNNPLMALGVIGESSGHAGIETIEGKVYISTGCDEEILQRLWQETLLRSPLYQTLRRSVTFNLELKLAY